LRPYTVKSTGTRPISEVKPLMAQSLPGNKTFFPLIVETKAEKEHNNKRLSRFGFKTFFVKMQDITLKYGALDDHHFGINVVRVIFILDLDLLVPKLIIKA
ncbi:4590_t:CDS:2, partial [Funneliformis mosseae]